MPDSPDKSPNVSAEEVKKLLAQELPGIKPGKDWPMLGGSAERAGLEVTLKTPLELAWKLDTGGRIISSAAIQDGRGYAGSLSGKIVGIDLKSGSKLWEKDTGAPVQCTPAAADGLVYCGSDNGTFYALNGADGKVKWTYKCGGPIQASPALKGGIVVFGADDHHIYMLDRKTGKKLWSFRTTHPLVKAPPVIKDGRVYAAQWIDWVYALDAATGKELWKDCIPISIESLQFYGDKLWLRTPRQYAEFDPKSGKRLRLAGAAYGYNGIAFMNDWFVYAGTGSAGMVKLEQEGKPIKFAPKFPAVKDVTTIGGMALGGWPRLATMGTPLVLGDTICLATRAGELLITKPNYAKPRGRTIMHKQLWNYKLGGTCHATPIAADSHLVVGCDDGYLYCFRETGK